MPRPVAGKTRKKGNVSPEQMQLGIDLHIQHHHSIRRAAKEANIPYQTLQRYVSKYKCGQLQRLEPNYTVNKIFSHEQELSLKQYIVECAEKFYGLTTKECRKLAYQMAKLNNLTFPKSWEDNQMVGKDWVRGFRRRFPELTVKRAEACSMARATAFNKVNVQNFYKNLKVCERHPSFADGRRIYNLDETSTTTVQRPPKVVAQKGRSVCKATSGERGVLVTTCCIVNALGQALPPAMVFFRKNFKSHMLYGAPPGKLGLATTTGWMNADLFIEVMRHFIKFTSASKDNPALLIMDNHESHLSIQALDIAKDNGVTVLTLHPHTTAKMQPLDVGLHAPFKTYYNAAVDSFPMRNPGKIMTIYNVAECVGVAYLKSMTPENIISSFKKCGLFPFNDNIFDDLDFLPSSVTDRYYTEQEDDETDVDLPRTPPSQPDRQNDDVEMLRISPSILPNEIEPDSTKKETHFPNTLKRAALIALNDNVEPLTNVPINLESNRAEKNYNKFLDNLSKSTPEVASVSQIRPTTPTVSKSVLESTRLDVAGPSKFISPKDFRKPLIAEPRKKTMKRRTRGKSIIATDTPEKEALATKKRKSVKTKPPIKKVKKDLFLKEKKKKKQSAESSDTSIDENENEAIVYSGSSSGGENFISNLDDDVDEVVLSEDFLSLKHEPCPSDYVLIRFKSKKDNVYYVAQVIEKLDDDDESDFFVSYLKLKSKVFQTFIEPLDLDTAGVKKEDIKYILTAPKVEGTTRRKSTYKFPVDMSLLKLRF